MRFSLTSLFDLGELSADLRRSLGLVYASSVLVIMGVNLIQPALPAMIAPFGITDAEVGLIIAVYTAPAIVLAPLLGVVADRYGRRPLLTGGLLLFGVAGTAVAFAPGFGWVLALRAVQGIGFSAVIPLTIVLIGDLLEDRREVSGQGLKVFIDRVGELVLPPLGGALALVGWRWPFLSYAAAIPWACWCSGGCRRPAERAPRPWGAISRTWRGWSETRDCCWRSPPASCASSWTTLSSPTCRCSSCAPMACPPRVRA